MARITHLWSLRGDQRLRRHWISFTDRIVIAGEHPEQAGELTVRPGAGGELLARLRVEGREYDVAVYAGNDISVRINGLMLFVGVKAVNEEHLLVAFGIPHGSSASVTVEAGPENEEDDMCLGACERALKADAFPVGICQTSSTAELHC